MKRVACSIIAAMIMLCGCSTKSPDNGYDYCNPSEMSGREDEFLTEIKSRSYGNLNFSKCGGFDIPENIYSKQMMIIDGFENKWDVFAEKYIPQSILENADVINDARFYPYGNYILDSENDFYCGIGCTGFFSLDIKDSVTNEIDYFNAQPAECHTLTGGRYDGEFAPLVADADLFLADFLGIAAPYLSFSAEKLSIFENNEKKFVHLRYTIKTDSIDICGVIPRNPESVSLRISDICSIDIITEENGEIIYMTIQNMSKDYGEKTTLEKIISPVCATELISKKLSENIRLDVLSMRLVYVPVYVKNVEQELCGTKIHQTSEPTNGVSYGVSYDVYDMLPYWEFSFDYSFNNSDGTPISRENIALVSCTDGSVEIIKNW